MHGPTEVDASYPADPVVARSAAELLAQAIALHKAWEYEQAGAKYRAVLALEPGHADANHNLGVLLTVQLMQPEQGLPLFEAALSSDPTRPQFWLSYVDALSKAGNFLAAQQVLPLARMHGVSEPVSRRLEAEIAAAQRPASQIQAQRWTPPARSAAAPAAAGPSVPGARQAGSPDPGIQDAQALVDLFNRKAYAQGEQAAIRLVRRHPRSGIVWKMLGAMQQHLGKSAPALESKRKAVQWAPDDADAHSALGSALVQAGELPEAVECFLRATALRPGHAQTHFHFGNVLLALGRFDQAEAQFSLAREAAPDWADAHSNLGFALQAQARLQEAAQSYVHALALAPKDPVVLTNLGVLQDALGRSEDGVKCLELSLSVRPDDAETYGAYGNALRNLGRLTEAETAYRHALRLAPGAPRMLQRLAVLLLQQGRLEESEAGLRRCLAAEPERASAHFDLGTNLIAQKRWDAAEAALLMAIDKEPTYLQAHINLSRCLYERSDYRRGIETVQRSLEVLPDASALHTNMGVLYTQLGQVGDAIACFRRALALEPDSDHARSCMLYAMSHSAEVGAQELAVEHRRFGERMEARVGAAASTHRNGRQAQRALRVGFVSADFRDHALAKFFEPFIERFARCPGFSCVAYYNHAIRDATTRRIDACFDTWRPVAGVSDERLLQQIEEDGIDILVDLTSHTAGNRLAVFARKPAPVQITWMGYPGSTGLRAMDYRFVEHFFLPSEAFDAQFTEQLVQLPLVSPFNGIESMPDVAPAPVLAQGHMTFGSFNRLSKINQSVVRAWAQVLRAVPDARMLLAGLPPQAEPEQLLAWFREAGVERERLILHPRTVFYDYMQLHNRVDIALDTFPYTGGTTTNHALWMGVPTLTIAGDTLPSRQSATFLSRVGLRDFIATDVDGLVARAQAWSRDPAGLQSVRARLRPQLLAANANQQETVVAGVSVALRRMWQRWCDGLPAAPFKVEYADIGALAPDAAGVQKE